MRLVSFTSLLAISLSAGAQEFSLSEEDFLAEDAVSVSSATRIKQQQRNVPASVTVITREMIEASSAVTIVELMRLVPGFQVGSKYGNESTVTYHGLSNQHNTRLHILINGRSVYDPIFGGTLWYTIPVTLDEVESIEVLRGPNAASYGANSFSGVINIRTFNAEALQGTSVSYRHGNERNANKYQVIHAGKQDNTSYRVSMQHESNDGFEDSVFYRLGPLYEIYDDGKHTQFNARLEYAKSAAVSHIFEFGIKDISLGSGFENLSFLGLPPRDKKVLSFYENYVWQNQVSLLEKFKFQISHTYNDFNDVFFEPEGNHEDGTPNPPGIPALGGDHLVYTPADFLDQRFDIEFEHSQIHKPDFQTVWGAGIRYDVGESTGYFAGQSHDRFSARIFGHLEWKFNQELIINLGGLGEYHENIGNYFSPRLGINYHLTKDQSVRINWSTAYRVPGLHDEYSRQFNFDVFDDATHDWLDIGNPNLDPEKIEVFEVGYLAHFFDGRLSADLRFSKERITDVIDRTKTDTVCDTSIPRVRGKRRSDIPRFRFINYGDADIDSVELELKAHFTKQTFLQAHASYANAYGAAAATSDPFSNSVFCASSRVVPESVPLVTTGLLMSHQFSNSFKASAQYNFVEAYETGGSGDYIENMESFDLKFLKTIKVGNNPIELSATVKNVFDNAYEEFDEDNLVGMETYFQIKLGLN